ncbi:MAG: YggT family protein [Betaproteobacteria bacterium]|jgi:YggT family protein|nr:YggT family protein [Betaproteobacteria bacterium]
MLDQAAKLILDVAFGVVVYSLLIRFLMQLMRAPFRNPLGQAVMALTDWIVKPLRKLLPGFGGVDWATLVAAFVLQVAWLLALYALLGRGFALGGAGVAFVLAAALLELAKTTIWILILVVIAQAVLSWVAPDGPLAGLLNALTFPFLRPLRRFIPPLGGSLDLTPLILIVLLQLVLILPVAWLERLLATLLR